MKTIACIFALTLMLAGCASLCEPGDKQCQHDAKEDAADVGAGIGAAIDILGAFDTPPVTTTTETRTCTKDRRGDQSCTTTQQTAP